jgi:hypothetical protein
MVVLYTSLLVLLGAAHFLIKRRAARLERKYSAVLKETNTLLHSMPKDGNSNRPDPCQSAKKTYLLGVLATRKERLETKHYAWQSRAEKVGNLVTRLRRWKGRQVPYVFGVIDAVIALCVLEGLGYGQYTNPRRLLELVTTWISG